MTLTPTQAATDVLDRADQILATARTVADPLVADDLKRHALAQGVAALDTYLHWAVNDAPLEEMPNALSRLDVPFSELVALSEAMVADRDRIRPKVRVRGVLERLILKKTFQSVRGVEAAMQMLGVNGAFTKISEEIQPHQPKADIEERLTRIVHRRNQVVHEGDLQRQSRPQSIKRERVDNDSVEDDLVWLRLFLMAIDTVLS